MTLYRTGSLGTALTIWCAAICVALVGYLVPAFVRLLFTAAMCVAFPIGWMVSHTVLIAVFLLVITPVGLVMRALGRDALDRTFDREAPTYWQSGRTEMDKTRYLRQF